MFWKDFHRSAAWLKQHLKYSTTFERHNSIELKLAFLTPSSVQNEKHHKEMPCTQCKLKAIEMLTCNFVTYS